MQLRNHFEGIAPWMRLNKTVSILKTHVGYSIIDVGCNDGYVLSCLNPQPFKVVGVDISELNILSAQERIPTASFKCADAQNLPFADKQFNMVLCTEVIEHIADTQKVIKELCRVSNKYVLISVPMASWYRILCGKLGKPIYYLDEIEHLREYSYIDMKRFTNISYLTTDLKSSGLKILSIRGTFFWIFETKLNGLLKRKSVLIGFIRLIDDVVGAIPIIKYMGRYLFILCEVK